MALRSRLRQRLAALLLPSLLAGCTAIPRPRDAMAPVTSPASWTRTEPVPPSLATALQPTLLWRAEVTGKPHRLWWGGETLLAAGMTPTPYASEDHYLKALDLEGRTRWERNLRPARLIDAAVDDQGEASLSAGGPEVKGSILRLDRSGRERWSLPWQNSWPRTLRVGGGGRCLVVGHDGQSGAFPGKLEVLGPDGAPLFPAPQDRLVGFTGLPSADCSAILLGYEGGGTGLYRSDLYRGNGVHLLDRRGQRVWSLINYHRPLAVTGDGGTAVVIGVPSPDRAYQPPAQDREPAPPYGQLLWVDSAGEIRGRYRLPFAATVDFFQMTGDGEEAALVLTTHRYTGGPQPEELRRVVWLSRGQDGIEVAWQRDLPGRLIALHLASGGSGLLVAEQAGEEHWLTLFDPGGKVIWRYRHAAPVVAALLSPSGGQAAVLAEDGLSFLDTHLPPLP